MYCLLFILSFSYLYFFLNHIHVLKSQCSNVTSEKNLRPGDIHFSFFGTFWVKRNMKNWGTINNITIQ